MKKLVLCTIATLALLLALPALANDAANPTQAVQIDAAPEPLFLQGPPAEFPGRGNVCRIPPPFQPESCICPPDLRAGLRLRQPDLLELLLRPL